MVGDVWIQPAESRNIHQQQMQTFVANLCPLALVTYGFSYLEAVKQGLIELKGKKVTGSRTARGGGGQRRVTCRTGGRPVCTNGLRQWGHLV